MPQFDPSSFASQLFWLYVSFALLILLLSIFALPKIGGVLEERQKRIDSNLDKAAQWKSEAEAAIAAYESALREARAEAQRVLQAGAASIALQAEARQKALGERLAQQIGDGERRIAAAKERAMAEIETLSAELVGVMVQRLTGETVAEPLILAAITAGRAR